MIKQLATKTVTINGKSITINVAILEASPIVYEVQAALDTLVYVERHTIGADGLGPTLTKADLQAAIIDSCQKLANKLAWHSDAATLIDQLS